MTTAPSSSASIGDLPAEPAPDEGPEPSIFLISLHIIMWTTLGCGLIMSMVVAMLNW